MYICCHSTGAINAIVHTVANYGEREKGMVLFLFQRNINLSFRISKTLH